MRNLQSLKKYHALGQAQLWLDTPSPDDGAAPAPVVPTFRDESVKRPNSAPNGRPTTANRSNASKTRLRNSSLSGHLPVSSSKSQPGSLRGRQPPAHADRIDAVGNQDPVESWSRPYTAQPASTPSGTGFKDILDAQSEFKPLDFKLRLKASGARDYGEDVADRNIGGNGHNLGLPQVQAFYARSTNVDTLGKSKSVSKANVSRPYQRDLAAQLHISKPASLEPAPGKKHLNHSGAHQHQHEQVSQVPQLSPQKPPTTWYSVVQRPTTSDEIPQHQSSRTTVDADAKQDCTSGRSKVRRLTHRGGPPDFPTFSADGSCPAPLDDGTRPPSSGRSFPLKQSKKGRSGTAGPAVSSTKVHTKHAAKPSVAPSIATYHTAIDTATLAYPTQGLAGGSASTVKTARRASLPLSPLVIPSNHDAGAARYEPHTVHDNRQRTMSLTSSLKDVNTDGRSEVVPPRTSSLRHWSISSPTPTTSDTSSNPFQRPQSRTTATTSVDLGKDFAPLKADPQLSLGDVPVPPPLSAHPGSGAMYIDGCYISSDDDSLQLRIPRGSGEEELLFSTAGYGTGSQLPGLFDALASTPPGPIFAVSGDSSRPPPRPRSSASLPATFHHRQPLASAITGSLSPRAQRPRYILDTAAHYDSTSDSGSDSDSDSDARTWHGGGGDGGHAASAGGMMTSASSPVRSVRRRTRRLSALGSRLAPASAADVIEEERDWAKVDVAVAVRQRKEEKARRRAAGTAARQGMLRRRRRERTGVDAEGNEAQWADGEC